MPLGQNCPQFEISCPEASMLVYMGNPAYQNVVVFLSSGFLGAGKLNVTQGFMPQPLDITFNFNAPIQH